MQVKHIVNSTTSSAALSSTQGVLWKAAVEDELNKWIFELKPGHDGFSERYKVQLVAIGCSQRAGLDYNETFAPVFRLPTLSIILALVAERDLDIIQIDVTTAFL